jgi:hypothetical protein
MMKLSLEYGLVQKYGKQSSRLILRLLGEAQCNETSLPTSKAIMLPCSKAIYDAGCPKIFSVGGNGFGIRDSRKPGRKEPRMRV